MSIAPCAIHDAYHAQCYGHCTLIPFFPYRSHLIVVQCYYFMLQTLITKPGKLAVFRASSQLLTSKSRVEPKSQTLGVELELKNWTIRVEPRGKKKPTPELWELELGAAFWKLASTPSSRPELKLGVAIQGWLSSHWQYNAKMCLLLPILPIFNIF